MNPLPRHFGQGLFKSGDLLGPFTRTLEDSIAGLEPNDQTIWRGNCYRVELPGLLDHHARQSRQRTVPDFHGVLGGKLHRWRRRSSR